MAEKPIVCNGYGTKELPYELLHPDTYRRQMYADSDYLVDVFEAVLSHVELQFDQLKTECWVLLYGHLYKLSLVNDADNQLVVKEINFIDSGELKAARGSIASAAARVRRLLLPVRVKAT